MNKTTKNIILTISFIVLITSLFLTQSAIIHAVLTLLVFGVAVFLLSQSSSGHSNLDETITEFKELLEFKRNKININESTNDSLEKSINSMVKKYQDSILEDTLVAGQMVIIADKVSKGVYSSRIDADSKTPYVHVLRNSMNNMLNSSESNLDNAISTLQDFSKGVFASRSEVNVEAKMAELLNNINHLGESLQDMQTKNDESQNQIRTPRPSGEAETKNGEHSRRCARAGASRKSDAG